MAAAASSLTIGTSWGSIRIAVMDGQVVSCTLPSAGDTARKPLALRTSKKNADAPSDVPVLDAADAYVRALFMGANAPIPPLAFPGGTRFQQAVWRGIAAIPRPRTLTYGELAGKIRHAGAARAVGSACGANPLPLFIPCHRVVGAGGALGGYTGGLAWKKFLLELERSFPAHRPERSRS